MTPILIAQMRNSKPVIVYKLADTTRIHTNSQPLREWEIIGHCSREDYLWAYWDDNSVLRGHRTINSSVRVLGPYSQLGALLYGV